VYFPNGKMGEERLKYKMDFYEAFLKFVDSLKAKGNKLIICGDFNTAHKEIDLARPKENASISGFLPIERAWLDKFVTHGYIDTFRQFNKEPNNYTWWDMKTRARERNVGWRIDYFFVTENLLPMVSSAFIMAEVTGSDHCPVGITLKTA
jgi:exodeoxyribonuclease-3